MRAIAGAVHSVSPEIEISAAVLPDPAEALERCHQDWPRWLAEGWCDRVMQMAYTGSPDRVAFWQKAALSRVGDDAHVVLGFGLHRIDPPVLASELARLRAENPAEVAIFSDVEFSRSEAFRAIIRDRWSGGRGR